MIFGYFYRNTALGLMHSRDLDDMRRAIGEEDQDGPDGGSPHVNMRHVARKRMTGASAG